jgi:dinuclear metal center YbgI/SA1388 family protein
MKLKDILSRFEIRLPLIWQESWDYSGLLLGSPEQNVTSVLFAYEICLEVIEAAVKKHCQLIITHHPFRMKASVAIHTNTYEGRLIQTCLKNGIALYSAHTNHDASPESLNHFYLAKLGLKSIQSMAPNKTPLYKLVVMTPNTHSEDVLSALFKSGAGGIGNYSECSFRSAGTGTFKGNPQSQPAIGKKNIRETVAEDKIEVIVTAEHLNAAIRALLMTHPYEEVAYDILPLQNQRTDLGLGAWGQLAKGLTPQAIISQLKAIFKIDSLRWVSNKSKTLKTIGLCTGSGTALLPQAFSLGLDLFITGDIKYHQAIEAKRHDLALADIGHFASEREAHHQLLSMMKNLFGTTLNYHKYDGLKDPFEGL